MHPNFRWAATLLSSAALLTVAVALAQRAPDLSKEWPTYGHDSGGQRFSPLTQITPANVANLKVAWTYHLRPADYPTGAPAPGRGAAQVGEGDAPPPGQGRGRGRGGSGFLPSGVTPLVIDGTMYLTTPYGRVVAVDPTSGKELWAYKLPS